MQVSPAPRHLLTLTCALGGAALLGPAAGAAAPPAPQPPAAGGAASAAPVTKAQMRRWRLTRHGLGPIRVGRTVAAVERRTGRRMVLVHGDHPSCELWRLAGAPRGLSILVAHGRVARAHAFFAGPPERVRRVRGPWRTSEGIRIGSTERSVRRRYSRIRTRPHPYVPEGRYLIVGGRRQVIFETNSRGLVTSFRGGRVPEVRYIEGCA